MNQIEMKTKQITNISLFLEEYKHVHRIQGHHNNIPWLHSKDIRTDVRLYLVLRTKKKQLSVSYNHTDHLPGHLYAVQFYHTIQYPCCNKFPSQNSHKFYRHN